MGYWIIAWDDANKFYGLALTAILQKGKKPKQLFVKVIVMMVNQSLILKTIIFE